MSPSERREMIRKENTDLSLTRQCKLLKISRSSIYYTPVGVNAETLKLMHVIDRVFTKYPFFGSRQIAGSSQQRYAKSYREIGIYLIYQGNGSNASSCFALLISSANSGVLMSARSPVFQLVRFPVILRLLGQAEPCPAEVPLTDKWVQRSLRGIFHDCRG
jgi:hypothetical protein